MSVIGDLVVKLRGDSSGFISELSKASNAGKSFSSSIGKSMADAVGSMSAPQTAAAAVGVAVVAGAAVAAKGLYDLGSQFDENYDRLAGMTGATGKRLEEYKQAFRDVYETVPEGMSKVTDAVGTVVQSFGLTGKPLAEVSRQFIDLARISGLDLKTGIQAAADVMHAFGITSAKDMNTALDQIYVTSTKTNVGMNDLLPVIQNNATAFTTLGLSLKDSLALLGGFHAAGVPVEKISMALNKGIASVVQPSANLQKDFAKYPDLFGNFVKAGDDVGARFASIKDKMIGLAQDPKTRPDALQLAYDTFGKRGGLAIYKAFVQGGKGADALAKQLDKAQGRIHAVSEEQKDLPEKLSEAWHKFQVAIEPLASAFFNIANAVADKLMPVLDTVFGFLAEHQEILKVLGILIGVVLVAAILVFVGALVFMLESIAVLAATIGLLWSYWQTIWDAIVALALYVFDAIVAGLGYVADFFVAAWGVITGAVAAAWSFIIGVLSAIVDFVVNVFSAVWDFLAAVVSAAWGFIVDVIATAWGVIAGIFFAIVDFIVGVFTATWNFLAELVSAVWNFIMAVISTAWGFILGIWTAIIDFIYGALQSAWWFLSDTVTNVWNAITGAISGAWNWLVGNVLQPLIDFVRGALSQAWGALQTAVENVWHGIQKVIDDVIGALRGIVHPFAIALQFIVDKIPGIPGGISDAVKAVVNWTEGKAAGGTIGPGFMTSGPQYVVGEGNSAYPEYVLPTDPKYRSRALALYGAYGKSIGMGGGGGLGTCVGCMQVGGIIDAAKDVGSSIVGGAANIVESALGVLGLPGIPGLPGISIEDNWKGTQQGPALAGVTAVRDWFVEHLKDFVGGALGMIGAGPVPQGACPQWIADGIQLAHGIVNPQEVSCALKVAMRESGCNPRAINLWDSNAAAGHPSKGLMQTIDGTFNAYRAPGCSDIWNPVCNAAAASGYVYNRYGNWCTVASRGGGYAAGGVLPVRIADRGVDLAPGLNSVYNGLGRIESLRPTGELGNVTVENLNVYPSPGMNEEQLADLVVGKLEERASGERFRSGATR